jgi:phenylacetate-CoA ligase
MWIAGTYTYAALSEMAKQGHKITVATPGINKTEIIHILESLAPYYDQVILCGYPPFVKDILDEAEDAGIKLSKLHISLLFAGETYSERWRDYVLSKIGRQQNLEATVGIYGTADAGLMGHENPFSIFIRRTSGENDALHNELFPGTTTIPTLVAYDPKLRYFETADNYLIFTTDNALPLIRYKINDQGRILQGKDLEGVLDQHKLKIPAKLARVAKSHTDKPYIALYGRSDVATTFYALDIYPENIKYGLEKHDLQDKVTGKFILRSEYDRRQNQTLHLYVELRKKVGSSEALAHEVQEAVMWSLRRYNSEYNKLYTEMGAQARPRVKLVANGSPEFEIKIKHRWTKRH